MSAPFNLIIGSHNHAPYGTGEEELERLYCKRLKPFVVALHDFPKIPAVIHYSGVVLQWIEKAHPEFLMLIKELTARKQIELLGGGFYEPLLPLLPLADKIGQIELLTTYLRTHFNKKPQGCWLPALAWDQNLIGTLNTCGLSYAFLGEEQFLAAGLSGDALYAPCISEDQGKLLTLFPFSAALNREADARGPFPVLADLAARIPPGGIVSLFPQFYRSPGGSPSDESQIRRFFEELSRAEPFVGLTTPAKFCKNRRGLRKACFASSAETGACPPAGSAGESRNSLSHPRQFLIDCPEANGIYAKMMFTHLLINHLRGDKSRKRTAREELWKAQGCDTLCPGGGVYRRALRGAAYRALLSAEKTTREKGSFVPSVMALDFDLDGEDEYLFQQEQINCYVKSAGASVFELDYLPRAWNYLDTLAPRRGPGGEEPRRSAFADSLIPAALSIEDMAAGRLSGSRRCGGERYDTAELDKSHGKVRFCLAPKPQLPFGSVEIEKTYQVHKDTILVRYGLTNRGTDFLRFRFLSEIDLSLPGEGPGFQRLFALRQSGGKEEAPPEGETGLVRALEIEDLKNESLLSLGADQAWEAWVIPVRTSHSGAEAEQYQSTCVIPVHNLALQPGERWETVYTLRISR